MFTYTLAVQGRATPTVIEAMRTAGLAARFDRMRAAFAYAKAGGAQLLNTTYEDAIPNWRDVRKRWLVSFDFGHTDPEAVEFLASLRNSEVRVPYAEQVVARNLKPAMCFHQSD